MINLKDKIKKLFIRWDFFICVFVFISFILASIFKLVDFNKLNSSYNLGVAITALAIIVTFIEFISNKNKLIFKLNVKKREVAIGLAISSILLVFLGELNFLNRSSVFEIAGAIVMFISILIYLSVIITKPKKLNERQILKLQNILDKTLPSSRKNIFTTMEGCIEIFDILLNLSLNNKKVQNIFRDDFSSEIFLSYFSESHYIFNSTIQFYITKKKEDKYYNLNHIKIFIERLFLRSLNNKNSFLNRSISGKIYPESLFYLDEVMLKEKNKQILNTLFGQYGFNSKLSKEGQLNYINLVNRYFNLIYKKNINPDGPYVYRLNAPLNDNLVITFFEEIKGFFKLSYDEDHLEDLLENIDGFSIAYKWGVKKEDKSDNLREKNGEFLYDILSNVIGKFNIKDNEAFRVQVGELYDLFIYTQEYKPDNIACDTFIEKLKEDILGDHRPNYKGYYPPVILIYFYIFGYNIFTNVGRNVELDKELHIPVLTKLAESFPKLYKGYRREYYSKERLPEDKKEILQKEGREIINQILPKNIVYNFNENSLSYYYSGGIDHSKIYLDTIEETEEIKTEQD